MLKKLIQDESGLTAVDFLVGIVVGVILIVIAFACINGGVRDAATCLGSKIKDSVSNSGASW